MVLFKNIESSEKIKEIIKSAFLVELSIDGGWGYTQNLATIIESADMPIVQLQHTIASMRTHIEMGMTLPKDERYAGINLSEKFREKYTVESLVLEKVDYEISAIKEDLYKSFISEYKEGYGKKDFDMRDHFERKNRATLKRTVSYWFEVSRVL